MKRTEFEIQCRLGKVVPPGGFLPGNDLVQPVSFGRLNAECGTRSAEWRNWSGRVTGWVWADAQVAAKGAGIFCDYLRVFGKKIYFERNYRLYDAKAEGRAHSNSGPARRLSPAGFPTGGRAGPSGKMPLLLGITGDGQILALNSICLGVVYTLSRS